MILSSPTSCNVTLWQNLYSLILNYSVAVYESLHRHSAQWSDAVATVCCCTLHSPQAPKQSLHFLEICQPLISTETFFFPLILTKQHVQFLCPHAEPISQKQLNQWEKWANITVPVVFCTELWGGPTWLLCAPVANLGWLVEAGSKQPRAEEWSQGSYDQSDQRCGSKCLIQHTFLINCAEIFCSPTHPTFVWHLFLHTW